MFAIEQGQRAPACVGVAGCAHLLPLPSVPSPTEVSSWLLRYRLDDREVIERSCVISVSRADAAEGPTTHVVTVANVKLCWSWMDPGDYRQWQTRFEGVLIHLLHDPLCRVQVGPNTDEQAEVLVWVLGRLGAAGGLPGTHSATPPQSSPWLPGEPILTPDKVAASWARAIEVLARGLRRAGDHRPAVEELERDLMLQLHVENETPEVRP